LENLRINRVETNRAGNTALFNSLKKRQKKGLKISNGGASIKGMNCFVFNEKLGKYEQADNFLTGKSPTQIAKEYGISEIRARQYALEKKLPYYGEYGSIFVYVFDATAEEAFKNRKTKPGREATEKPPKVPGKPGRPRKEKPVKTTPKNPVGRPRKNPVKAFDIVPKKSRGRPRKKK